MPRKDRTFSDKDLLRILINNLTREEKLRVLEFFGLGLDLPEPKPKDDLPKKKVDAVRIEVEIAQKTVQTMKSLIGGLALVPGPQQGVLRVIDKLLSALLTILTGITKLLL